jgi:integrase
VAEQAIELAGGKVIFRQPKWDSKRIVDIPEEVVEVLEQHLASVSPDRDALLFTDEKGQPLRRTRFRKVWEKARAKVGCEELHFHDLRGSGATWAAMSGATLKENMKRLGHRTPTAALSYQHVAEGRGKEIADRMGALLRAAQEARQEPAAVVQMERS